jgi:hypothetical protein
MRDRFKNGLSKYSIAVRYYVQWRRIKDIKKGSKAGR